jgi:hypothetical protein
MFTLLKRLFAITGIILIMVVVTAFLATPQVIVDLASRLDQSASSMRAIQVVAALLIDFMLIVVVYRLIRPRKAESLVVRARGAKAAVSIDSVQRQINTRIAQVSDVLHVHTEVDVQKGSASVTLNVRTRPDIVIPEKQKELSRVLRQLVEKQMGLRLAGPPVIHLALATDEFDAMDRVTTVVEPIAEAQKAPQYASLPEKASYTEMEIAEEEADPVAEQVSPAKEPWRDFLLGDNS